MFATQKTTQRPARRVLRANKELRKLRDSIDLVTDLRKKNKEIEELKSVIAESQDDKEMQEMASEELRQATEKEKRLQYLLLKALLPKDDANERDCILEVRAGSKLSGGSGGQHANTTNSAVRITHVLSGLTVAIQDERSHHQNKAKALKVLCAKLYEMERTRAHASQSRLRAEQIVVVIDQNASVLIIFLKVVLLTTLLASRVTQ